jgi:hypothetical protein
MGGSDRAVRDAEDGRSRRAAPPRSEERARALASPRHVGVGARGNSEDHATPDAIVASDIDRW